MGGRGAFLGDKLTTQKWSTTFQTKGIKLIEPVNGGNTGKTPTMSKRPNEIYAILNSNGNLKSIVEYGENRQIVKQYHYDHSDNGKRPHIMTMKDGEVVKRNVDYADNEKIREFVKELKKRGIKVYGY